MHFPQGLKSAPVRQFTSYKPSSAIHVSPQSPFRRLTAAAIAIAGAVGLSATVGHGQSASALLVKTWDINRATGGDVVTVNSDGSAAPTETSNRAAERPTVIRLQTTPQGDQLWFGIS